MDFETVILSSLDKSRIWGVPAGADLGFSRERGGGGGGGGGGGVRILKKFCRPFF